MLKITCDNCESDQANRFILDLYFWQMEDKKTSVTIDLCYKCYEKFKEDISKAVIKYAKEEK